MTKNIKQTKQKNEKKENTKRKIIKVVNVCSYVLSIIFILVCIVSCSMSSKENDRDINPIQKEVSSLVVNNDLTIDENGNDKFVNYNDTKAYYVYDSLNPHNATISGLNNLYLLFYTGSYQYGIDDLGIYSAYKDSSGWQHEFHIKRVDMYEPYPDNYIYKIYDDYGLLWEVSGSNDFNVSGMAQYFKFTIDIEYPFQLNSILTQSFSYMLTDIKYQYQPLYLSLAPYLEFTPQVRSFNLPVIFDLNIDVVNDEEIPPSATTTAKRFSYIKYEYFGAMLFEWKGWGATTPTYSYDDIYILPITLNNGNYKYALNTSYNHYERDLTPSPKILNNIVCSNVVYEKLQYLGYWQGDIDNRYYFNDMTFGDYRAPAVWLYRYYKYTAIHNVWENSIQSGLTIDTSIGVYHSLTLNIYAYDDNTDSVRDYVDIHLKFGSTYVFHGAYNVARHDLDINTNDYIELIPADSGNTSLYDSVPYINRLTEINDIGITYNVSDSYSKNDCTLYAFLEMFTNTSNSYYSAITNSEVNLDLDATFNLISFAISSLLPFLTIAILPNITIGALILIPLAISIIIFVFRMFKR